MGVGSSKMYDSGVERTGGALGVDVVIVRDDSSDVKCFCLEARGNFFLGT